MIDENKNKSWLTMFHTTVKENGNLIAVICGEQKITYHELDKKSSRIAQSLIKLGIQKNDIVGILMNRSIDLIASGLATLFWTKLLRTRNYFNYSSYPADFRVFNPLYSTGVR